MNASWSIGKAGRGGSDPEALGTGEHHSRCYTHEVISVLIKGLVHFQIKISWKCTHPNVIQDAYVFPSSVEKKFKVFDSNVPGFVSI